MKKKMIGIIMAVVLLLSIGAVASIENDKKVETADSSDPGTGGLTPNGHVDPGTGGL